MRIIGFKTARPRHYRPMLHTPRTKDAENSLKTRENPGKSLRNDQKRLRMSQRWPRENQQHNKASRNNMIIYLLVIIALIYLIFFVKVF